MQSVRLSPSGNLILAGATPAAKAADAAVLGLLSRTKGRTFLNTLTKLAKLSDEAAEKAERAARRQAKRDAKVRARKQARAKPKPKRKPR
jgi:hypothetical protein